MMAQPAFVSVQPRPGDEGTYELVDQESGIHILLWFTSTEQDARRYLGKMSHMMDLELGPSTEPVRRTIDDRAFWVLACPGAIEGRQVHQLLAVAASGRSRIHPRENNLYIVQMWCPRADRQRLAGRLYELLDSVRITDRP